MEDDVEFAQHMLRSNIDNKNIEEKSTGMKQVEKNNHMIASSNLSSFPESIIFQFLIRIPPRYIHKNFMPVCKSWKELFSQRSFAESRTELLLIQAASSARHMRTKLLEIGKELECESRDLGINRLGHVRASCDGFLLVNKPKFNKELQVINPTTKICITIPKCPSSCQHEPNGCSAAIGFDSTTKQYKVVHIVTDSYGFEICNLSGADDDEELRWERISGPWEDDPYNRPFNPPDFRWKNPVSINGRVLHWYVDSSEYIISMEVNKAKFSRTYLPKLVPDEVKKRRRYELIELGGFLSFVYCDFDTKMDVWILEGQCWSKKHSIVAESINYISPKNVKSSRKHETSIPDVREHVLVGVVSPKNVKSSRKYKTSMSDVHKHVLVGVVCPKNMKPSSKYETSMPDLGKLVPVGGVRNGEVLIFKHKNSSNIYVYDTNTRAMKKASINMKNVGTFVPYKDSLFSMKRMNS